MHYLAFDIETVVNGDAQRLFAQKEYKPDPQYNDLDTPPSSITKLVNPELKAQRLAEWQDEQRKKLDQSILQKKQKDLDQAALYWWTGQIVAIGMIDLETGQKHMVAGDGERSVLEGFFRVVLERYPGHVLIGKRSSEFDIPYIVGRAMAHDIGLIPHVRLCKEPVNDVNRFFGQTNSMSQVASLANLAHGLGISGKLGHGSDVAGMWARIQAGEDAVWRELTDYCLQDVAIVAEALRRWRKEYSLEPALILDAVPDEIFGT